QASEEQVQTIMKKAKTEGYTLTVNLEDQIVSDNDGFTFHFDIAPYPKEMLLNGWDEIGVTLNYEDKIKQYELAHG
ncbi:3-isopropylmalate dehydratase small subunit, partial [Alkalihalophilus lindianensis]|nr:3-isopropylmalate dehydratase small subunit [Alkalihalophilus lindianensis]